MKPKALVIVSIVMGIVMNSILIGWLPGTIQNWKEPWRRSNCKCEPANLKSGEFCGLSVTRDPMTQIPAEACGMFVGAYCSKDYLGKQCNIYIDGYFLSHLDRLSISIWDFLIPVLQSIISITLIYLFIVPFSSTAFRNQGRKINILLKIILMLWVCTMLLSAFIESSRGGGWFFEPIVSLIFHK